MLEIVQPLRFCGVLCIARSVASLGRHAQLMRCFSAVAELLVLYDAKTWTLLSCDEKTLEAFHMKCQRQILHIAYTGLSMSQTQKYPLAPAYHLLWTSSEDVACQYSAT